MEYLNSTCFCLFQQTEGVTECYRAESLAAQEHPNVGEVLGAGYLWDQHLSVIDGCFSICLFRGRILEWFHLLEPFVQDLRTPIPGGKKKSVIASHRKNVSLARCI